MLKEVIVVEGKMDTAAVKRALDADTIETGGFTLSPRTIKDIEAAYRRRGIIILTDPDAAGERIRKYLTEKFPGAGQAFIPKDKATADGDVGVEQADKKAITAALKKVRYHETELGTEFTGEDLFKNGLSGNKDAAKRRAALMAELGLGFGNAKRLLERLNRYGVTRDEFDAALKEIK